ADWRRVGLKLEARRTGLAVLRLQRASCAVVGRRRGRSHARLGHESLRYRDDEAALAGHAPGVGDRIAHGRPTVELANVWKAGVATRVAPGSVASACIAIRIAFTSVMLRVHVPAVAFATRGTSESRFGNEEQSERDRVPVGQFHGAN